MIFVTFALLVALRDVLHFRGDRKRMRFLADGLLALRAHAFIAVIADALRSDTTRCRYEDEAVRQKFTDIGITW